VENVPIHPEDFIEHKEVKTSTQQ